MNALFARDVQYLINDTHNIASAAHNAISHSCTLILAHQCLRITDNLRITTNNIERRTNLMAHVLQEVNLHTFSFLSFIASNNQFAVLLLQLLHILTLTQATSNIAENQHRDNDDIQAPTHLLVMINKGLISQLSILQVVGRAYHLFTHDDVVHRVFHCHILLLHIISAMNIARQFVNLCQKLIGVCSIGQLISHLYSIIIMLIGNKLTDFYIVIVGGTEVFSKLLLQLHIFLK